MATAFLVMLAVLGVALLLAVVRLAVGPQLADQVVALELVGTIGVSGMAIAAIAFDSTRFLDVAILLALVGFISTAAFAHYIELERKQ